MYLKLLCWTLMLLSVKSEHIVTMSLKIGVSKNSTAVVTTINETITNTTSASPAITQPTTEAPTTPIETTEESNNPLAETTTASTTLTTTTTSSNVKTTFPNFLVPTLPSKTTQTTTTLTTTTATATASTPNSEIDKHKELEVEEEHRQTLKELDRAYCDCNLMLYVCDINCCCDPDCSSEAFKVFDCFAQSQHSQLQSRLEDFEYQHGLPSCKINDGWLCVFRTNTPPAKQKIFSTNLDTMLYYKWPSELLEINDDHKNDEHNFYKYDEVLKLLNKATMELEDFVLPYAFKPPYCLSQEPIRHLKPLKRSCLVTIPEASHSYKKKLLQLITTHRLMLTPKLLRNELGSATTNTRDIKVIRCVKKLNIKQCNDLQASNANMSIELDNAVHLYATAIIVKIFHNYTSIISSVIEISEEELPLLTDGRPGLWQQFEVRFHAVNATDAEEQQFISINLAEKELKAHSGPLGYLIGEPIIIAKFITTNSSEEITPQNQILDYFHINASKSHQNHTLKLFSRHQELCQRSDHKADAINYGISTMKQCKLRLNETSLSTDKWQQYNFTAICQKLQQLTLKQLFGDHSNLERMTEIFISQLGKAENSSDKWLQLKVRNTEFAPVMGQFNQESKSFICRNVLLSVSYEFHVGAFMLQGIPNQAMIKYATLLLGQRNDLEFAFDEIIEVPLSTSVMFYDATIDACNCATSIFIENVLYISLITIAITHC